MEKHYKLQNIITYIIEDIKKQDFLVYFRKISILEISHTKIVIGVVSTFMKDNLEAKFYNQILLAVQKDSKEITSIEFKVDHDIDNPSNKNVIDCTSFYKENEKNKKSKSTLDMDLNHNVITPSKSINNRYNLTNFIV